MTLAAFLTKYNLAFANNVTGNIKPVNLRDFVADLVTLFNVQANFKGAWVAGAKKTGEFWVASEVLWRAKQDFNSATAPTVGNAYWEKVLAGINDIVVLTNKYNEFTEEQAFLHPSDQPNQTIIGFYRPGYIGATRFQLLNNGRQDFGDGVNPTDVSTYRMGPGVYGTDGKFNAEGGLQENAVELSVKYAPKTRPTKTITGHHTITADDNGYNILYDSTSPGIITVPNSLAGSDIALFQVNTGSFEFQAGSGATLENFGSKFKSAGQKAIVTVVSRQNGSSVVWHPNGDLIA